ncbi:MAG: carbon-nitrogen hydrolase family protein [Bacteroidales bacterium]
MKRRSFVKKSVLATYALGNIGMIGASDIEKVRIAVVQQDGNPGQVSANLEKALHFAEEALNQNADVILFHEELLVAYVENARELAEPVDGPTSKAFQELLRGTDALVIYGLTEKDQNDYYISAPIVSADGVIENYRKTHLWWHAEGLRHEPTFYKPGNRLVTFDVKGYKSGIMICYDGDFPEMTRSYANLGCTMLFWMNNRGSRGHAEVKDLAYRNSMIIPAACCCGLNEVGDKCEGGSNITGAKGELITEIWDKEGLIIGDVNPGEVSQIRENNPWFTGSRPDLYHY